MVMIILRDVSLILKGYDIVRNLSTLKKKKKTKKKNKKKNRVKVETLMATRWRTGTISLKALSYVPSINQP